ncbi:retron Ec78 anti-phage system effector HNH endonuclease PtuB [Devosia sp.]|uniref:retron Ec78 anti-phage system effector HNH endonuclease PtuB n=1 Tax=Devosia sp. TaxID=1871048 RepID=UPI0027339E9A|nr:retron Ec78 anti-phage system effector HNH endonuclease PtuB [Devosia sp.]MDP2778968.1 retron Ec78 anti-phage system effector HNH endonuclease PtuB [Devosia sp.]
MRKLQRVVAPECLKKLEREKHTWDQVTTDNKNAIWEKLELMQGKRCAYCESPIDKGSRHIEHFRQRSDAPKLTFFWENLFGSCSRTDCCGKYKDVKARPYDPKDLIKPDEEDPEDFFIFSANGSVSPRADPHKEKEKWHRAMETIRIFNLNGPLQGIRHAAVRGYVTTFDALVNEVTPKELNEWILSEVSNTVNGPFVTAIRHVLTNTVGTSDSTD